jgi:beta-lactamase class A
MSYFKQIIKQYVAEAVEEILTEGRTEQDAYDSGYVQDSPFDTSNDPRQEDIGKPKKMKARLPGEEDSSSRGLSPERRKRIDAELARLKQRYGIEFDAEKYHKTGVDSIPKVQFDAEGMPKNVKMTKMWP